MKEYHRCAGKRVNGKPCWYRGVVVRYGKLYCKTHAPVGLAEKKEGGNMDEILKTVLRKVAEHITRLANGDRTKSMAIAYKAMDFLLVSVRNSVNPAPTPKNRSRSSQ